MSSCLNCSLYVAVCSIHSFISYQEQILLLNGDDFTSVPLKVLRDVEKFVGVPHFFHSNNNNIREPFDVNKLIMGKHPNSGDPYYDSPRQVLSMR